MSGTQLLPIRARINKALQESPRGDDVEWQLGVVCRCLDSILSPTHKDQIQAAVKTEADLDQLLRSHRQ